MNAIERQVLDTFKSLLLKELSIYKIVHFGFWAKGEALPDSIMDVLVLLDKIEHNDDTDYVSDCAWAAGFDHDIVIMPVVLTRDDWQNRAEQYSRIAEAVEREGVAI